MLCQGCSSLLAQNQAVSDSLKNILENYSHDTEEHLEILEQIAFNENEPNQGLRYANKLIQRATALGNDKFIYHGYLQKGYKLNLLGELDAALEALLK